MSAHQHHRDCICKHVRPTTALGTPHWADLNKYCPVHGTKNAVPHDLERFPQSLNSYSCKACQHGDHAGCEREIRLPDWSNLCACMEASPEAHAAVARRAKREELAFVIYAVADDLRASDFWLSTADGTPNSASYAIADALIESQLTR